VILRHEQVPGALSSCGRRLLFAVFALEPDRIHLCLPVGEKQGSQVPDTTALDFSWADIFFYVWYLQIPIFLKVYNNFLLAIFLA